jgi:hypothetical protein
MTDKLEKALRDAKKSFVPKEPDWDAVDAKLFARIEADKKSERDARVARVAPASRTWAWVAGGLAVAAAAAVFVGKHTSRAPFDAATSASAGAPASALLAHAGTGDVLIGGAASAPGTDVRAGDILETRGATAYLERAGTQGAKPAVTWDVEDQSKVTVTRASGTLIVAVDKGAVEAQVTPVPSGEAFAVDVAAADGRVTRVAVHGTHLRVARVESAGKIKVVVDLNEGVVSIGTPPRTGSTYGTLVTAPAHVELDAQDPSGTIVVSHAQKDVRAAVDLAAAIVASSAVAQLPAQAAPNAPAPTAPAPVAAPVAPRPVAHPAPPEPAVDPNAPDTIAKGVRQCMASHAPPADAQVRVSVSTALELHMNDRGFPDFARFDPPLPKDVQDCASGVIYKTRFASGGTTKIQLDF